MINSRCTDCGATSMDGVLMHNDSCALVSGMATVSSALYTAPVKPASPTPTPEQLRQLSDLFWQFHQDRLNNPELIEMKPYIQPILNIFATFLASIELPEKQEETPKDVYGTSGIYKEGWNDYADQCQATIQEFVKELQHGG